jgi:hypothetical protein
MNGEVYIYIEYHDDDDISGKKKEFLLQFFFSSAKLNIDSGRRIEKYNHSRSICSKDC